ncbi:NADPH-dependent FMN reductase [Streptomyces sp. NPDC058045]|uniref:NADPH-dependent FMN reductase n=1 Tax=Streptomyces sp. NPDC058045 TaxID=3346311 RepID=UPI0036E9E22D
MNHETQPSTAAPTALPTATEPNGAGSVGSAEAPLRVVLLVGSNRSGRFGPVVARWLLDLLAQHPELDAEVVDVADPPLPAALTDRPTPEEAAQLASVQRRLATADAFLVLTPEYNHSYPAPLKNLLDWYRAEWQAKPVGFVSYGGVSGGLRAVEHLRQVFAELHTVTVRETVSFHQAGAHFDDEGRHRDPGGQADAAAKALFDQLTWWGLALRQAREARPYGG